MYKNFFYLYTYILKWNEYGGLKWKNLTHIYYSSKKYAPFISLPNLRKLVYSLLDKQKYVYGTFIT